MDIKQYVISLLESYNDMKQEINALQYELAHFQTESTDETIAAMIFSSAQGERIDSGGTSNKTPEIALTYAQKNSDLENQAIREIIARLKRLCETTDRLDFYIDKLPAHQTAIIRNYYFDGYSWREIESFTGVSYKTLVRHKNNALKALVQSYFLLGKLGLLDFSIETSTSLQ